MLALTIKRGLPMLVPTKPWSMLERILLGIVCVGFCTDPEQASQCRQTCRPTNTKLLNGNNYG